jgi:hypothetical protein
MKTALRVTWHTIVVQKKYSFDEVPLKSLKALLSIEKIVEACFIGKKCV